MVGSAPGRTSAAAELLAAAELHRGRKLTYRVEMDGVGSVQVMGGLYQIAVEGTMDMTLKVEDVTDEGNYQILTALDAMNLNVTVDGQAMPLGQKLPRMRTVITPRGETLSLELIGGQVSGQMEEQLTQLLAERLQAPVAGQKMAAFPEGRWLPGQVERRGPRTGDRRRSDTHHHHHHLRLRSGVRGGKAPAWRPRR